MTSRNFVLLAAIFGFIGVGAGAFGAHALTAYFNAHPDLEDVFRTGTQYEMYHTLALIGAAWVVEKYPSPAARWSGILFAAGIVLFSGSLYLLSLLNVPILGAITPFGGLAFLAGWACLGWAAWKGKRD